MTNAILNHVGGRIRLYRKSSGMSAEELAKRINKSKASVSKYESGQVAVDVITLCEIADALGIPAAKLLDYPRQTPGPEPVENPFGGARRLYLYHLHRRIHRSVLCLSPEDNEGGIGVTLFYKVDDPQHPEQCQCIYNGRLHVHDTVVSVVLRNFHNAVENALLTVSLPLRKAELLVGMFSGLGSETMVPTAQKILLSREPLEADERMREILTIDGDTLKALRRNNVFYIPFG